MSPLKSLITFLSFSLATAAAAQAAVTDYVLQPSDAEPVNSLSSVRIQFPEAKFLGMYGSKLEGVTLTKADDPSVVYEPFNIQYSTFEASNSETFSLRPAGSASQQASVITAPGEYILHFPAKCFDLCGDWYSHIAYSEEINAVYTIDSGASGGYDSYFNPDDIIVTPASGRTLRELNTVKLVFPVTGNDIIEVPDISVISMHRTGSDPADYVVTGWTTDDERTIELRFRPADARYDQPEAIYIPGEYIVDIPAGTVRLYGSTKVNKAMQLRYTITGDPSGRFADPILTPSPGQVPQLKEVVITYPHLTEGFNFPAGVSDVTAYLSQRVYLRKLNSDPDYQRYWDIYSATVEGVNSVRLTFCDRVLTSPEPSAVTITTPGDYRLTVSPNVFKAKGSETIFNQRIEADYTIAASSAGNPLDYYLVTPADGASVGSLSSMTVTFPDLENGLVYPWPEDNIRLTNADDPSEVYRAVNVMTRGNSVSFGFNRTDYQYDDPLTLDKAATYVLSVSAGTWADYTDPSRKSPQIRSTVTVDPNLIFHYELSPADGEVVASLSAFTLSCTDGAVNPVIVEGSDPITISMSTGTPVPADCTVDAQANAIVIRPQTEISSGTCVLRIPAGAISQKNSGGTEVLCPAITAMVKVVPPQAFTPRLRPAPGSEVTGFASISITPEGGDFRSLAVDADVAPATLAGNGKSYTLSASASQYAVALFPPADAEFTPGTYTLTVPQGLVTATDGNGLVSPMEAVTATYKVVEYTAPDFSHGILFLNEGAFGSDFGSINFLSEDYTTMYYEVFRDVNHGKTVGVTAQYGTLAHGRLLIVSKQADYGEAGGLLTVADASTLKISSQIRFPAGAEGRAVCVVSQEKAYVGTSAGIYVCDLTSGTFGNLIAGTGSQSGPYSDQIGDMVILDGLVYAARQGLGVYVIDTASDAVKATVPLADVLTVFVTSENRLFAATSDPGAAFVEINPSTLSTTDFDVESKDLTLASDWDSWRKAPLATSIRYNTIFYATSSDASQIASYDFDTSTSVAGFIKLPTIDGYGYGLYGTGLSVDPLSGYVVMTAVQTEPVVRYNRNAVFFASPETGEVETRLTFIPEDGYWFPAMAIYADGTPGSAVLPQIGSEGPDAIYSLDGRIARRGSLAPGIYIERKGGVAKKIIIR